MALGRARPPQDVQTKSFQDYQQGALTIEQMANQSDRQQQDLYEREIQLADDYRAREDGRYFQGLWDKHEGDIDKAWGEMVARNAPMAYKMREMDTQSRMQRGLELEQSLKNEVAEAERASTIMSGINPEDPNAWAMVLEGLPDDYRENAPPEYDQAFVDNVRNMAESETDKNTREQANLTNILNGQATLGARSQLGTVDNEEEWNQTIEMLLSLPGMNKDRLRGILMSNSLDYPGQDRVNELHEMAFTPADQAANERHDASMANAAANREVQREGHEIERARYLGGESSIENLIAAGEPGAGAWQLYMARQAQLHPDGNYDLDEAEAEYWKIQEAVRKTPQDPASTDKTAIRNANAVAADEIDRLGADDGTPEWDEDVAAIRRKRDIALGAPLPEPGPEPASVPPIPEERRSVYKQIAESGTPEDAARQMILDNGGNPTPDRIAQVLQDYPELSEGGGGSTIGGWMKSLLGGGDAAMGIER